MPLPVVIAVVAVGSWLTLRRIRRPVKILVTGQSLTGKTMLINSWQGEWEESPDRTRPFPRVKVGTIRVDTGKKVLFVKKKFIFRKTVDISGRDESMDMFRDKIKAAKIVLYLMRATDLYAEQQRPADRRHADEWVRIADDAYRLNRHCADAERILLVVTHVDLDPRSELLSRDEYLDVITGQLADVVTVIGKPARIGIRVGSLITEDGAAKLAGELVEALL